MPGSAVFRFIPCDVFEDHFLEFKKLIKMLTLDLSDLIPKFCVAIIIDLAFGIFDVEHEKLSMEVMESSWQHGSSSILLHPLHEW
jgi:hypothetical protein